MSMSQAEVDLYNLAMDDLGQTPIETGDDGSPGGAVAERRYRACVRDLLSRRDWTFNSSLQQLSRLEAAPAGHYLYEYQLADGQTPLAVFDDLTCKRPYRDYRIFNGNLQANAETLWAELRNDDAPGRWPDHFKTLVRWYIAASACNQHTGSRTLRADLMRECFGDSPERDGGLFGVSVGLDSVAQDSDMLVVAPGPLIEARE